MRDMVHPLFGLLKSILLQRLDRLRIDKVKQRLVLLAADHGWVHCTALEPFKHVIQFIQQLLVTKVSSSVKVT